MKPKKKKLDIQAFLINHVEKIALAVVIPVALFIAWQGTKFPPLAWQPDDLQKVAADADNTIKASTRSAEDEGIIVTAYDIKAEWIKAKIHSDLYRTDVKWMPSLFPERIKRSGVGVFTVENLRSSSGLGAVTLAAGIPEQVRQRFDIPPDATHVGRRWAVITGLIPVKKQFDLYLSTFSASVHTSADRDTPLYFLYDIERAEVLPGAHPDNLVWQELDAFGSFQLDRLIWAGLGTDPVDPTFLAPRPSPNAVPMAYPLPPVAKRFNEEVTHPPSIPMLTVTQIQIQEHREQEIERLIDEQYNFDRNVILGDNPFGRSGTTGGTMGSDMPGNEMMGGGMTGRRGAAMEEMPALTVTDYLFRFFDFTVETGKTYRYRVRLYLANPNHNLGASLLEDPNLSKEPFLITEYSVPSNPVTIPLTARVLVNSTLAPSLRTPWTEPTANLYAVHFDMEDGTEWYHERAAVYRGQTANFRGDGFGPPAKGALTGVGMDGMGNPPDPRDGRRPQPPRPGDRARPGNPPTPAVAENKKSIDFHSEVCVLDIFGGSVLPRTGGPELRVPGRVVVLEPNGTIRVRKTDDDLPEIEELKNPVAAGRFGGGMPGMGALGGMGDPGMDRGR